MDKDRIAERIVEFEETAVPKECLCRVTSTSYDKLIWVETEYRIPKRGVLMFMMTMDGMIGVNGWEHYVKVDGTFDIEQYLSV